jgi:GNAT superfamily N-acetyltransferase
MPPRSRWTPDDFDVETLEGPPPTRFDCGRREQNVFLHRHAWADQEELLSTTYMFYLDSLPAAYATVCTDAVSLARDERLPEVRFERVSAFKLAQLGVHQSFQGQGIGSEVVFFTIELARSVTRQIGCRYVTVDAQPDLVDWYARQGFVRNRMHQEERIKKAVAHGRDPEGIAVSMRFDLK